ncbi:hypothetical protein D3C84_1158280 [compost metagenome]
MSLDTCPHGINGEQADARHTGRSGLPCGNDQQVGAVPIEYMLEGAVEDKAIAFDHYRCLYIVG